MKKQFKKLKGITTRFTCLVLVVILAMSTITSLAASAASYSWPDLSPSSYASYVAPANTSSLYQDAQMTIRGTANPQKSYQSSISRGDELMLMGFTENKNGIIVSYPVGQGRRTAYVPTKTLLGVNQPVEVFNAKASVPVYKITTTVSKWGSIAVNDQLFRGGSVTFDGVKYVLFVYEAISGNRGWKIGFLKMSDYEQAKNGTASTEDFSSNTTTTTSDAVKVRLDAIGNGSLTYDKNTVMKIGSTFRGTRSDEECKGFARNIVLLCFNKMIGSTQPRDKGLNYLLYESENDGIFKVGSVTEMTPENISVLFQKAQSG